MRCFPYRRGAARAIMAALALLFASLSAASTPPAFAQQAAWAPLGLQLADVRALAVDPAQPEHLYAGGESAEKPAAGGGMEPCGASVDLQCTYTDFFESRDGGAIWSRRNAGAPGGPPATNVLAIAVDPARPATLYVSNGGDGVYKSTDGGATWTARNTGLANGPYSSITTLLIDPRRPDTLYAADAEGVLAKSTDGAGSWRRLPAAPGARCGTPFLALAPSAPDTLYAGACEVDKSADGGASWRVLPGAPGGVLALAVSPSDASRVYAGAAPTLQSSESGAYRTTDGGATWARVDAVRRVDALAIDPADPASVFTASNDGVRWSRDGGQTWAALGNPAAANSAPYQDFHALLVADGSLYYGTRGGLWKYAPPAPAAPHDNRYFGQTGYRIDDDTIWGYFEHRGGVRSFGYPTSRTILFLGHPSQFFQRDVLQVFPDGAIHPLNLLDATVGAATPTIGRYGILPFTSFNFSTFPAADPGLAAQAPNVFTSPDYAAAIVAFVRAHAPDIWNGLSVRFYQTFVGTVSLADAYPNGGGNPALLPLLNLEIWGAPISAPAFDPNNHNFVYQRFQRGIMHYDAGCNCTQGILMGDYLKAIITGQHLPADLAREAADSPFLRLYAPGRPGWLSDPNRLPADDLTDAFVPE